MEGGDIDSSIGINNIVTPQSHISLAADNKKENLSGYDSLLEWNADCLRGIYFSTVNYKESTGKLESFHICLSSDISKTNDHTVFTELRTEKSRTCK